MIFENRCFDKRIQVERAWPHAHLGIVQEASQDVQSEPVVGKTGVQKQSVAADLQSKKSGDSRHTIHKGLPTSLQL